MSKSLRELLNKNVEVLLELEAWGHVWILGTLKERDIEDLGKCGYMVLDGKSGITFIVEDVRDVKNNKIYI